MSQKDTSPSAHLEIATKIYYCYKWQKENSGHQDGSRRIKRASAAADAQRSVVRDLFMNEHSLRVLSNVSGIDHVVLCLNRAEIISNKDFANDSVRRCSNG